jgi:hypothetical protein
MDIMDGAIPNHFNNDMSNLAVARANRGRMFLAVLHDGNPLITTTDYETILQHLLDILNFYCWVNFMGDVLDEPDKVRNSGGEPVVPDVMERLLKKQKRDHILVSSDCADYTIETLLQTQVQEVDGVYKFDHMLSIHRLLYSYVRQYWNHFMTGKVACPDLDSFGIYDLISPHETRILILTGQRLRRPRTVSIRKEIYDTDAEGLPRKITVLSPSLRVGISKAKIPIPHGLSPPTTRVAPPLAIATHTTAPPSTATHAEPPLPATIERPTRQKIDPAIQKRIVAPTPKKVIIIPAAAPAAPTAPAALTAPAAPSVQSVIVPAKIHVPVKIKAATPIHVRP